MPGVEPTHAPPCRRLQTSCELEVVFGWQLRWQLDQWLGAIVFADAVDPLLRAFGEAELVGHGAAAQHQDAGSAPS